MHGALVDYQQELGRALGEYANNFNKLHQLNDYYGHKSQTDVKYPSNSWMQGPMLGPDTQYANNYQPKRPLKYRCKPSKMSPLVYGPPPGKPFFELSFVPMVYPQQTNPCGNGPVGCVYEPLLGPLTNNVLSCSLTYAYVW